MGGPCGWNLSVGTAYPVGTTYYYKVQALNASGFSLPSNEASATTQIYGAPLAPTGLTATAGSAQVSLSWGRNVIATSYVMYRSTTSGGEGNVVIGTTTGWQNNRYTDTGVTRGTIYYYKVANLNDWGTSAQSNEASATPR